MNQVREVTKELVDAIAGSTEYLRYQAAKEQIVRYPVLKEKADEFRRRNYELQCSNNDIYERADSLRQEYDAMLQNSIVWEYLDAEYAFCRILQQVNWQMIEHLDVDMTFGEY